MQLFPKFTPLTKEHSRFFQKRLNEASVKQPTLPQVRAHLLKIGGLEVAPMPDKDRFNRKLLKQGMLIIPQKIKLVRGEMSHCHTNASRLWFTDDTCVIQTGFALSADGLWLQHSWVLKESYLIETTILRIAYFGYIWNEIESLRFGISNAGDRILRHEFKLTPAKLELFETYAKQLSKVKSTSRTSK